MNRTTSLRSILLSVGICVAVPLQAQDTVPLQAQDTVPNALNRFYRGAVQVDSVTGTIRLRDGQPPQGRLRLSATDHSGTDSLQRVAFHFAGRTPEPASGIRGTHASFTAPLAASYSRVAGGTQSARVDLRVQANTRPTVNPKFVDVLFELPAGATFLRSSHPLERVSRNGRVAYRLLQERAHPTFVTVAYTTGNVGLSIDKRIEPEVVRGGPVQVTLTVRNVETEEVRGVVLNDSYDPSEFAGEGPEFHLYTGEPNDRRLIWSRTLERLGPGESVTVRYTVTAQGPVSGRSLESASATLGERQIGASNKVFLPPLEVPPPR
jgi:hypothetical protein